MSDETVFTPSQVGDVLGIKSGMVRRYHLAYEGVTGEKLARDPSTNGRLVTQEQLAVLEQARQIVKDTNGVVSAEDAIKQVLGVITSSTAPVTPQSELLQAMVQELRHINERLEMIEGENKALQSTVENLTRQLPSPQDKSELEEAKVRIEALERDKASLEGELAEAKAKKPWWRLW